MKQVLLTGADSAIGARLLALLVARPDVERIRVLAARGPIAPSGKVAAVAGDLTEPRFGLDPAGFADLMSGTEVAFHCAERRTVDEDLDAARARNVTPVATLAEGLESAPHLRLIHLSTTWVCGTKRGLFTEFDLACGQQFYNAYEQTKHEAELALRASGAAGRITIVRRSAAPGGADDDAEGPTIDGLVPLLTSRPHLWAAADPRVRVDFVSADRVARDMAQLAGEPASAGRTVHLVSGWSRSPTLRELLSGAAGKVVCLPRVLAAPIRGLSALTRGHLAALPRALSPYLLHRAVFDDFMARSLLRGASGTPARSSVWRDAAE